MIKKTLFFVILLATTASSCDKEPIVAQVMEETFYVRNGGSDMPAFVRGNSASKVFVVYLQGGPGFGSLAVEGYPFGNSLEQEYAMVYWDQRHTGNSHGHFDKDELNMETVVKDVHALVKTIKMRYGDDSSIFLMGASWGGLLTLSYLVEKDYQEEIKGWISVAGVHTKTSFRDKNEWVLNLAKEEIAAAKNVEEWTEIEAYFSQLDIIDELSPVERAKRNGYISQIIRELIVDYQNKGSLPSRLIRNANDLFSNNFNSENMPIEFRNEVSEVFYEEEQMKAITSPALLLYGKYDYVVPAVQGQRIYDQISSVDKEYKVYQKSGHGPMFTEPDLFVKDVSAFIETHK